MGLMLIGKFSEAVSLAQIYLRMPYKISSKEHRYYLIEQLSDYLKEVKSS